MKSKGAAPGLLSDGMGAQALLLTLLRLEQQTREAMVLGGQNHIHGSGSEPAPADPDVELESVMYTQALMAAAGLTLKTTRREAEYREGVLAYGRSKRPGFQLSPQRLAQAQRAGRALKACSIAVN